MNLAPSYEAPPAAVPRPAEAATVAPIADPGELAWKDFFVDPTLRDTVALSLANNRDLRVAALSVEQARAQYGIQRAAAVPGVSAGAGVTRSGNDVSGVNASGTQVSANLALSSFELDLFGRVRNLSESALQAYFASDESRRSVHISLVAEVANAWLNLAADQARRALAEQTLQALQRSLELNERRHALGAITGLALAQSQSAVDSARIDVIAYATQVEQDRHALELLLGAALPAELQPQGPVTLSASSPTTTSRLVDVPAGVPSALLLRRPDVRSAEHQLQAANADIGVARAARFPRISLTASAGTASRELSGLFDAGSRTWSFGPSLSVPIFDGGAGAAGVRSAEYGRDIALAQYDKAVQTAFREVADSLSVRATLAERLAAQAQLIATSERQLRLAEAQFRSGSTTLLEVLDAQRSLYASQQGAITLQLTEQSNRIALYKALGGGWRNE